MPKISIGKKAAEISSLLREPSFLLKKRLEAASLLAMKGKTELEDFAVEGEKKLQAAFKHEGGVIVLPLPQAMKEEGFASALQMPFSGVEQEEYLLSLALFTQGNVVKLSGREARVRLEIVGEAPRHFATFYLFAPDCTASVFAKTSFSSDAHECRGLFLGKGASAQCCFVQSDSRSARGTSGMVARLDDGAQLKFLNSNLGGKEKTDCFVFLQEGRGSRCEHYEASLSKGSQRFNKESEHVHLAPDTYSRSIFKYATDGSSQVHVNGKVTIEQGAPGSDTHLLAKSLLLSENAISKVIPMLFVRNADVAAGHGSAMTPFSDEELFYLRSRGIGENESRRLILQGFLRDLLLKSEMEGKLLEELQLELDADAASIFPQD